MRAPDKVLLETQEVPAEQEHLADQAPGRTMADVQGAAESAPLLRSFHPKWPLTMCSSHAAKKRVGPTSASAFAAVLEMNLHTLEHGRFFSSSTRKCQCRLRHRHGHPR